MCPFFFFNDTATTEIYTLSLHDALPICSKASTESASFMVRRCPLRDLRLQTGATLDRKSTRLNSSHLVISYAVFCLKKKNHSARRWRKANFPRSWAASFYRNSLSHSIQI